MTEEELEKDVLFQIDMQLYDEFNDKLCEINEHLGDIYTYKDLQDVENAEKERERMLLRGAIKKQDTEINKLKNVIDRMAEVLNDFDYDKQCESCRTDICSASVDGTEYTKCIKEYFMKENTNE